jgi:hypothetical protein
MKRSAGVTIAAVIALLGSICAGFFAVIGIIAGLFLPRGNDAMKNLPQQGALPILASMIVGALFEFGFAGWGLATAIGLIRLKPWSRISILIYAGLLAISVAFMAMIFMLLPLPVTPNTSQNFNFIIRFIMASICVVPFSIAVWWLVLFTRKSVVAQFSGVASNATIPATPSPAGYAVRAAVIPSLRRPLTITIIAWLYVVSVPMMIPSLLLSQAQRISVPFFWTMLEDRDLLVYFALISPVMLAAGISLLKNKAWGYWLAVGIQSFGILNLAATLLWPGRAARWATFTESLLRSFPPENREQFQGFLAPFWTICLAGSCLVGVVVLWLFWTRRKRFLDFAAMQSGSAPNTR